MVIVGDGGVGKTCLFVRLVDDTYEEDYTPTVFENYDKDIEWRGKHLLLKLWDTAGQEDYDRIRPLSYSDTKVVMIAFSVDDKCSLDNVQLKWFPEVQRHITDVKILLIGMKSDLRSDKKAARILEQSGEEFVKQTDAQLASRQIGSVAYLECSAKTNVGVKEVFDEAIRSVLEPSASDDDSKGNCCNVM